MAKGNKKSREEICLDVFIDHYDTLTEGLPVKSLLPKFVKARVIRFSDEDEISKGETENERARRFLRHISTPLETGNIETFRKMLSVVEKHGGQYAYLAKNIKVDLLNRGVIISDNEDAPDGVVSQSEGSRVPLDVQHLTDLVVPNMATKWFEMGLQLGVDPKELKIIKDEAKSIKKACIMMFMEWLDNVKGTEKSWRKVLSALRSRSVGENTLAKNLEYLA